MKTFTPKPADLSHEWYIVDATDVVLGRLSSQVATLLRGKNKPTYAPHADSISAHPAPPKEPHTMRICTPALIFISIQTLAIGNFTEKISKISYC